MSQNKTQPTSLPVKLFLDDIPDDQKRADSWKLYNLMERLTNTKGCMWGTSIVGFGEYHYKYKTGREGDWFLTGFAPSFVHRAPFWTRFVKKLFRPDNYKGVRV